MDDRQSLIDILRTNGLRRLTEPVQLSSGAMSQDFVDGKIALAHWDDLELAGRVMHTMVTDAGVAYDAVGGLTMGADALAVSIAAAARCRWFFVRKQPKGRGTNKVIEGAAIGPGDRVLVVDDVITTGGSLLQAVDAVEAVGAKPVAAVTLVDRGDEATPTLRARGLRYLPVATYRDLGIEPVLRAS